MKYLELSDIESPTHILNHKQGNIYCVEIKCKAIGKLRHKNISEFKIAEARLHDETNILWIPGKTNPADMFAKKDKDVGHFEGLQDHIVKPKEEAFNI